MAAMLIVLADSAVLDFMDVYLTAYVVLYILSQNSTKQDLKNYYLKIKLV